MKNGQNGVMDIARNIFREGLATVTRDVSEEMIQARGGIVIKYYRQRNYGKDQEYVFDLPTRRIIHKLTGKITIDSVTRELLRDLTGGVISWEEVLAPRVQDGDVPMQKALHFLR
jgi:hypothetical protein